VEISTNQRLRRTLTTLSTCNRILVRSENEDELANAICRTLVEIGGFALAWVGFAEDDADRTIRPVASAGCGTDFIARARLSWADVARGRGPSGRAVRTGMPWRVADIATDPDFEPWREDALASGLRSCLSVPLIGHGQILGVLGIYGDTPGAFHEDEIGLLNELGEDLSLGLIGLRNRVARQRAELRLLLSEKELLRLKQHLAQAQEVGHVGSAELDLLSGEAFWSDEHYRLMGLEPNAVPATDERLLASVLAEDRPLVRRLCEAARLGKDQPATEFRLQPVEGEIRWVRRQQRVVRDADGRPVKVVITLQDISNAKRSEVDLQASRENLAAAQRVGRIGSSVIDLQTGASHWSDELYALFGLDPATSRPSQETVYARTHPDDLPTLRERRLSWGRGIDAEPGEFRIKCGDDAYHWFHIRANLVADDGRPPTRVIATFQDITERKQAQKNNAALERQLMQAQKMEAIGNLTGGIAHDFNNLLTVILGHLDLIESKLDQASDVRAWTKVCRKAIGRGARLTRSMLAFARQQPLRPTVINIGNVVQETCDMLRRTLGEGIEIVVEYGPNLWMCEADPVQLQNALINLAINARDAMPQGGRLLVEARNASLDATYAAHASWVTPGDYVALSVTDSGTGIPAELLGRVFEPFFTTKEPGKGSGLGLSMVYGFAKQSGGHVQIYSETGKGTAVKLYLPRSHAAASEEVAAPPHPSWFQAPRPWSSSKTMTTCGPWPLSFCSDSATRCFRRKTPTPRRRSFRAAATWRCC
jgi:signal transduction histidine kinase